MKSNIIKTITLSIVLLDNSFQCETGRILLWKNAETAEMG